MTQTRKHSEFKYNQQEAGTIGAAAHTSKRRRDLYENSNVAWSIDKTVTDYRQKPVSVDQFETVNKIGEGTYGAVFRARAPSGRYVAMKKVRMENEKEGFPITAIREIKILKALNHPNIVPLLDVVTSSTSTSTNNPRSSKRSKGNKDYDEDLEAEEVEIYMVFEYLDHDLAGIMSNPEIKLQEKHIKYYLQMILEGLYYLHEKCNILHRDIKGANVLINNSGEVKLADFGLSRIYHPGENREYTSRVVTLWYRAPELLLENRRYSPAIDIQSLGCLNAEMIFGKPTFPANSEIDQLNLIYKLVGSPTEETQKEGFNNLNNPKFKVKTYPRQLDQRQRSLKQQSPLAFDLLSSMLVLDPDKRITAADALLHDYFHQPPFPEKPPLDSIQPSHEYETRVRKNRARQRQAIANNNQHHRMNY